jgi:hypothetical protein
MTNTELLDALLREETPLADIVRVMKDRDGCPQTVELRGIPQTRPLCWQPDAPFLARHVGAILPGCWGCDQSHVTHKYCSLASVNIRRSGCHVRWRGAYPGGSNRLIRYDEVYGGHGGDEDKKTGELYAKCPFCFTKQLVDFARNAFRFHEHSVGGKTKKPSGAL